MLKCLHIKGRGNSMELLEQSSLRDASVRALIISGLRIQQGESAFACSEDRKATPTMTVVEFKKYKSWLNFRQDGSGEKPSVHTVVRWCARVVGGLTLAKRRLYWPTTAGSGHSSFLMISKLWLSWVKMSTTELENRACSDVGWNCARWKETGNFHTSFLWPKQPTFLMSVHINIFVFYSCAAACFLIGSRLCSQQDGHYHTLEMATSGSGDKSHTRAHILLSINSCGNESRAQGLCLFLCLWLKSSVESWSCTVFFFYSLKPSYFRPEP